MKKIAYCRVSTKEQNLDRQVEVMKQEGVQEKNIYKEKMSGKNFGRPQYNKMLRKMKEDDLLVIKSIDRLGRNYSEILEEWRKITKVKKANIQVLDMPLLNTDTGDGDLTGVLISDLVLQILAYVAEKERELIRQRQAEGIAIAMKKGTKFGRPRKEVPKDFENIVELVKERKMKVSEALRICEISESTFYRRMREFNSS